MRMFARMALLAAPLFLAGGLSLSPALADDSSCLWAGTSFPGGSLVDSNHVTFSCSLGQTGTNGTGPMWVPTGQTDVGTPVDSGYDGTQNPADYSPGATLEGYGDAWSLGSTWDDVGTWDSFQQSVDGGGTSGGSGGTGGLQP